MDVCLPTQTTNKNNIYKNDNTMGPMGRLMSKPYQ